MFITLIKQQTLLFYKIHRLVARRVMALPKGLSGRCVRQVVDFYQVALTDLDNAPSQAVAARLGMRDEGTTDRWFGLTSRQFRKTLRDHEGFSTV